MVITAKRQMGQAFPLALMVLGLGGLIIGPLLGYVSTSLTGLRRGEEALIQYYAADAGVEHALWRLQYEPGFAASLVKEQPFLYSITANGMPVEVSVTWKEPLPAVQDDGGEPPPQAWRITVDKTVEPEAAPIGVETLFTFAIQVENVGTSVVHLEEVGDRLPAGFVYEPGSSGGFTSDDPLIGDGELVWPFPNPMPDVRPGETRTQTFQARATLEEGIYYDEAWVVASPDSIGLISTGQAAPIVPCGERYNIEVGVGATTIRAATRIADGTVTVLSWDIR